MYNVGGIDASLWGRGKGHTTCHCHAFDDKVKIGFSKLVCCFIYHFWNVIQTESMFIDCLGNDIFQLIEKEPNLTI